MRPWIAASVVFFLYLLPSAAARPGLSGARRAAAALSCLCGLALCALAFLASPSLVLHEWILPAALLLIGYWASGLLFSAPMPAVERVLVAFDRVARVDAAVATAPRWLRELLELAYVGVYVLVPLALVVALLAGGPEPDTFWTVVLVTDYVCFGCLPWIQTRPPRALAGAVPWKASVRAVNLHVLSTASVQVNTFPSGHAAEAMAVALLVSQTPWPFAAAGALGALLVSAGAVLGRYHYAADALAGWAVALVVWLAMA